MTAFFKEIEPFRGNGNENEKGQTLEEFLEEYDPYKYKNPCLFDNSSLNLMLNFSSFTPSNELFF